MQHHTSCASFISKLLEHLHCKKRFAVFPSPDGMSLTKLPLAWNNLLFQASGSLVSDIPAEDGKISTFFNRVPRHSQVIEIWTLEYSLKAFTDRTLDTF